jgi:hypothetical protein
MNTDTIRSGGITVVTFLIGMWIVSNIFPTSELTGRYTASTTCPAEEKYCGCGGSNNQIIYPSDLAIIALIIVTSGALILEIAFGLWSRMYWFGKLLIIREMLKWLKK